MIPNREFALIVAMILAVAALRFNGMTTLVEHLVLAMMVLIIFALRSIFHAIVRAGDRAHQEKLDMVDGWIAEGRDRLEALRVRGDRS